MESTMESDVKEYNFPKWEGVSFEFETEYDYDEIFPTEVYDGEMSAEEFISQNFKGERVVQHNYRFLYMKFVDGSCEDYSSGATQATCFDVDENGVITEVEDFCYGDWKYPEHY